MKGHIDSKGHKKKIKDEASRAKAIKYLTSPGQAGSVSLTSLKKLERLPPRRLDKMVLEGPLETATVNKISTAISKSDIESLDCHKRIMSDTFDSRLETLLLRTISLSVFVSA